MSTPTDISPPIALERDAVLDQAHVGDIKGAFGTIAHHDTARAAAGGRACARCSRSSARASS